MKTIRSILALASIACASALAPCQAQSITGTWQLTGMKGTGIEKATGKQHDLSNEFKGVTDMFLEEFTFKADHTVIQVIGFKTSKTESIKDTKTKSIPGTYTLDGDKLTMENELTKAYKNASKGTSFYSSTPSQVTLRFKDGNMMFHFTKETSDDGKWSNCEVDWVFKRI